MKRYLSVAVLLAATSATLPAQARDEQTFIGAAVGGVAGALIGHHVSHRNGALVGGVIGAVAGAAIANNEYDRRADRYSGYDEHRARYDGYNGYSGYSGYSGYQTAAYYPAVVYRSGADYGYSRSYHAPRHGQHWRYGHDRHGHDANRYHRDGRQGHNQPSRGQHDYGHDRHD